MVTSARPSIRSAAALSIKALIKRSISLISVFKSIFLSLTSLWGWANSFRLLLIAEVCESLRRQYLWCLNNMGQTNSKLPRYREVGQQRENGRSACHFRETRLQPGALISRCSRSPFLNQAISAHIDALYSYTSSTQMTTLTRVPRNKYPVFPVTSTSGYHIHSPHQAIKHNYYMELRYWSPLKLLFKVKGRVVCLWGENSFSFLS